MGLILCPDALAAVKLPLMPVSLLLLQLLWAEVRTWRLLPAGLALQTGTWAPGPHGVERVLMPTGWLGDGGLIPRGPGGACGQGRGCSSLEEVTVQRGKWTSRQDSGWWGPSVEQTGRQLFVGGLVCTS